MQCNPFDKRNVLIVIIHSVKRMAPPFLNPLLRVGHKSLAPNPRPRVEREEQGNRSVVRACQILRCFEQGRKPLGLADVSELTALDKATVYRILTTLVAEGMIERLAKNTYASASRTA